MAAYTLGIFFNVSNIGWRSRSAPLFNERGPQGPILLVCWRESQNVARSFGYRFYDLEVYHGITDPPHESNAYSTSRVTHTGIRVHDDTKQVPNLFIENLLVQNFIPAYLR